MGLARNFRDRDHAGFLPLTPENSNVRQFRDAAGVVWNVSMTTRSSSAVSRDHHLPEAYREGWLLFESPTEKRRLAPVPPDWESLSDEALAALCAGATPQIARPRADGGGGADAPKPVAPPAETLRPKLHDVERQLDESLDEVCDAPAASKLDTGELIRVEETLAVAAEAAKEAVSLRRRLRADREADRSRDRESSPDEGAAGGA
jgi:hypothetical protein